MSSESRVLRPFNVDKRLEEALRLAQFSYGDLRCAAGERVLVEDGRFGMRPPILEWCPEQHFAQFKRDLALGAVDTHIDKALLCLAVTARSAYLKMCELVYCHPLSDLERLERRVRLDHGPDGSRRRVFCAETHGAVVDAYIALRRPVKPRPFTPSRSGAWFGRASFRIECQSDAELFRPQPLDDEERARLGLADGAMRFLELDADSLTVPLTEADVPTLWVDEQLLTDLDRHGRSAVAQHIQRQLALDVIAGVVFEFARSRDEDATMLYEDLKDSLIGKVVRLLAGTRADDAQRDNMVKRCRNDPRWAIAHAEDAVGLRASALKSLEQ